MSLYIELYTPLSFLIKGDTKPVKDSIKSLGGKFGIYETVPAWMFPRTMLNSVKDSLRISTIVEKGQQPPAGMPSSSATQSRYPAAQPRYAETKTFNPHSEASEPTSVHEKPVSAEQFLGLLGRFEALDKEVANLDAEVATLDAKVVTLDTKISSLDKEISELKKTNAELKAKYDSLIIEEPVIVSVPNTTGL